MGADVVIETSNVVTEPRPRRGLRSRLFSRNPRSDELSDSKADRSGRHRIPWRQIGLVLFLYLVYELSVGKPHSNSARAYVSAAGGEGIRTWASAKADQLVSAIGGKYVGTGTESTAATVEECIATYRKSKGREPPERFDKWCDFAIKRECAIDGYKQIDDDFAYWWAKRNATHRKPMTKPLVRASFMRWKYVNCYNVTNGKLSPIGREDPYGDFYSPFYRKLAPHLPNMIFTIGGCDEQVAAPPTPQTMDMWPERYSHETVGDMMLKWCPSEEELPVKHYKDKHQFYRGKPEILYNAHSVIPVLSNTKLRGSCGYGLLIPSLREIKPPGSWKDPIDRLNAMHEWESKKDVLYFRGTVAASLFNATTYHMHHRVRLMLLAQKWKRPDLDLAITGLNFAYDEETNQATTKALGKEYLKSPEPLAAAWKYKYLLDLDGGTGGYSGRTAILLGANSLLFRATIYKQYFDGEVKPWVHYVPVDPDYSDLLERLDWARANPDQVQTIIRNANHYVRDHMRLNDELCYALRVLTEYNNLVEEYPWDNPAPDRPDEI